MSFEHDPPGAVPDEFEPAGTSDPLVVPREGYGSGSTESSPAAGHEVGPSTATPGSVPAETPPAEEPTHGRPPSANMLPQRERRRSRLERLIVRLIATFGIIAIGVAIAAIMVSSNSQGWIVGLVVSAVTVVLAGLLWSSRTL